MSVLLGVLGMGRAQAEARMTETVTITGESSFSTNATTLAVTTTAGSSHYSGAARVRQVTSYASDAESAGQFPATQRLEVHIPVGSGSTVATGDLVLVSASAADASLVGRKYRVQGVPDGGQVTARRFPVEAVS